MRLPWTVIGWTAALMAFVLTPCAPAQTGTEIVRSLEGTSVAAGQFGWEPLHKLLIRSFPDSKPYTKLGGTYYVWRIRSEDLVFQATNPASSDGQSSAGFYWFDLHGAPLAGTGFGTGSRSYYRSCALTSNPGVSGFIVQAKLGGELSRPFELNFGLDGYRPVLLRYAYSNGALVQNPYCTPSFACGPKPATHQRSDLLEALSGSNPMVQLEALTWLSGVHSNLTADITTVRHESISDSVRFWSLSNDSDVSQAASALESSQVPWVAEAAKFYVSVSKPQPVPNYNFKPLARSLVIKDVRIGRGGEFDSNTLTVKFGDRVVIEYEIRLPNGSVAFSDLEGNENPPILEVGNDQVIEGLWRGLIGMKVGGIRTIEIPSRMAYGDAGADVVPPGSDLSVRVRLLHIATEPAFGEGSERVIRLREVLSGKGPPAQSGATVRVSCNVFRLDGHEIDVPNLTGIQKFVLFAGSPVKKALLGMRAGGLRRLLVNSPSVLGQPHGWFHYSAQILVVKLLAINPKP